MRNRTFIQEFNNYSVPIKKDQLKYYAYIDYFKEEFQEADWNYFTQRITSKLGDKEPQKLIKTPKIKEFEAWVANL